MADGGAALNKRRGRLDHEIETSPPGPQPAPPDVLGFLAPKSLGEVKELARMIALAEWAPECYRDLDGNYLQPKIELAILHGATVGLGPIAAVHAIAVINGTPSIWGDGALSVIEHSGLLEDMTEDYEEGGEEGLTAICTMKRRDRATPIVTRFSLAMAERAGLTRAEGPWQSYPERMLRMRARSWTMRDGFADVLRGLQLREEVEDYKKPRQPLARQGTVDAADRGVRSHRSARPKLYVAAGGAGRSGRPDAGLHAADGRSGEPPVAQSLPTGEECYALTDADGVIIEAGSAAALRSGFERLFFDKHLSRDQALGIWESNAPARAMIERLFGAGALAEAKEHCKSIRAAADLLRDEHSGRLDPRASATASRKSRGQEQPAEPDRSLVLEISPTWGIQKIFHHYRAALTALAEGPEQNKATISKFRQANSSLETRLRTKLPNRMGPIDAMYQSAGLAP